MVPCPEGWGIYIKGLCVWAFVLTAGLRPDQRQAEKSKRQGQRCGSREIVITDCLLCIFSHRSQIRELRSPGVREFAQDHTTQLEGGRTGLGHSRAGSRAHALSPGRPQARLLWVRARGEGCPGQAGAKSSCLAQFPSITAVPLQPQF